MADTRRFKKILIANRGEIAERVARTSKAMGIATTAVYSLADENAPFVRLCDEAVRIGDATTKLPYLSAPLIIAAALSVAADAIHPGYGFLSENAEFAKLCGEAGIAFIGPSPASISAMGSKIGSKRLLSAKDPSIPVVPGYCGDDQSLETLLKQSKSIGFPLLVKASAGGGGKGMRIVRDESQLQEGLESAKSEAKNSFGDDSVLLERYFDAVRHIEVQVMGDRLGNVVHLFERECSVQRRHQKVIEESPSAVVGSALRERITSAAVKIAKLIDYVGAGTVEFILVDGTEEFYFLEMNTRLQVEHPVTEATLGSDLVKVQIEIAQGKSVFDLGLHNLRPQGHAIECRLYAEDPLNNFFPAIGKVREWAPYREMEGIRYDSGIVTGSEISVFYDPLLCKVIAHGETRQIAIQRMERALCHTVLLGVTTNKAFLLQVLANDAFRQAKANTHFIEQHLPANVRLEAQNQIVTQQQERAAAVALLYEWYTRETRRILWRHVRSGFRNNPTERAQQQTLLLPRTGSHLCCTYRALDSPSSASSSVAAHRFLVSVVSDLPMPAAPARGEKKESRQQQQQQPADQKKPIELECVLHLPVAALPSGSLALSVSVDGVRRQYVLATNRANDDEDEDLEIYLHSAELGDFTFQRVSRFASAADAIDGTAEVNYKAPMPARILRVLKKTGDAVKTGETVIIIESMKMEQRIVAATDGTVKVQVKEGELVDAGVMLMAVDS